MHIDYMRRSRRTNAENARTHNITEIDELLFALLDVINLVQEYYEIWHTDLQIIDQREVEPQQ